MATRSRIAIEISETRIESIYCHWDGYPTGVGATLNESYTDREKVLELIKLGDISSLGAEVHPTGEHSFSKPMDGVTVAYARDRGEQLRAATVNQTREQLFNLSHEDYLYLYTMDGVWEFISWNNREPQNLSYFLDRSTE
jgi:hypothetical protein